MSTIEKPSYSEVTALRAAVDKTLSEPVSHGLGRALRMLAKELALYEGFRESVSNVGYEIELNGKRKLQVGGGSRTLDEYLNIDLVQPADVVWDVREGIPLRENCIEEIFTEHFFEHIDYPTSAKKVIAEFFRVLAPKGSLILGVPDGEEVIAAYTAKDKEKEKSYLSRWYAKRDCLGDFNTSIDLVNYVFRDQDDHPKYNPHFWAYDFEKLVSLCTEAGFSRVEQWPFDPTLANPKREFGSIYIQAWKED